MKFALKNIETGKFVARAGSQSAYTRNIENIRVFQTREVAEKDRCVENEIIVDLDAVLS